MRVTVMFSWMKTQQYYPFRYFLLLLLRYYSHREKSCFEPEKSLGRDQAKTNLPSKTTKITTPHQQMSISNCHIKSALLCFVL